MKLEMADLFGVNRDHEQAYKQAPWYDILGLGELAWGNVGFAAWQKIYGDALGSRPSSLLPVDMEWHDHVKRLYDVKNAVRITKSGKGYRVFLPIYHGPMNPVAYFQGANPWYAQDGIEIARRLEAEIPNITDPGQSIDQPIRLSLNSLGLTHLDFGFLEEDDDALKKLDTTIKSYRLVAAPCQRALEKNVPANIIEAWGQNTADKYQARQFLSGLLNARIATLFMELEIDANSAKHICQGEPRLSLLGEYFVKALGSEHLFGGGKWCHNVVPISNIAKANARNTYTPVPRTDGRGLSVDAKGNLLWIPTVDNSEFVEEEMEQGGMQPNGEWTRLDTIDPENNEYIVAQGASGRNVRQRKPKGRNRLIYTDWYSARLSFTDDSGSLDFLDLSMYRPATVGQLSRVLLSRLDNQMGLKYALERGVELGARVQPQPELYQPFCDAQRANELTDYLNSGNLAEYVTATTDMLRNITRTGQGSRQWTPEEITSLDRIFEDNWLQYDLVHAASPVPFLRQLADILRQSYDLINNNQDQVFGRYVVGTVLKEMALLLVVVEYAGQGQQLRSLDLERRAKYIDPDLAPADQIEVKDIPFVSGNVELFPHQVKAWNYLKNAPEDVVLDVAAGGGKTMLALLDIAYHIGKGMRWPLIICPENLIKNYINDALWLFGGKMNMVVLNGTTFNSPEWGEEKLLELVLNAPVNTIYLTDYNFIIPRAKSNRVQEVMYGTELVKVCLNTEFLKKINWGGIWSDESHLTKNAYGSTNQELMRLMATIPVKRQLSGTYISDNLTDVVGQFGLINPQTFGDMETFMEEYFEEGGKKTPLPGAQRRIRAAMSENANVVTIRRKEWAALLPRRSDSFWPVEMSAAQQVVYNKILDLQREDLEQAMRDDPTFAAQFEHVNGEEDEGTDNDADVLDAKLAFYLQRLERFITAPGSDPYVMENPGVLTGRDLLSPKLGKLIEVLRDHKAKKIPGKVLVWTQYVESSASLFRGLPDDIRARSVLYTAANAEAAMSEFASNPNKDFMFGCEKSMNTGHNLQFCSRIIRMETVWNWGTLEQGEARINRPSKNDPRRHENGGQGIYYDWIFCNKSMDVTKNSRMISKLISTVKFYEQDNQNYQNLPELDPIKLSKENIFAMNDWQSESGCIQYFNVYAEYAQLEQKEFDDFVNNPANRIEPYTLEEGEILEGSGLLKRVPYIPQMELYSSEKLGLVPFVQYISSTMTEGKKPRLLADDPNWSPEGMKLHTEYGDCICKGYNRRASKDDKWVTPKTIRVVTPSGSTVSVPLTMAWVITKETATGEDVRKAIARKAGVDVGQEIVPKKIKQLKVKENPEADDNKLADGRKPADNDAPGFAVFLETYNHNLSLVVNTDDADAAAALPTLTKLGFVQVPDYNYTKLLNWKVLRSWIDTVSKKVEIHPEYLARLEEDVANWKAGKTMEKFAQGLASAQRKNFLLAQKVPLPKGIIKPYLVSHNHKVFLCLNDKVNMATFPKVKTAAVSGVSWKKVTGEHWMFATSKQAAQTAVKELFAQFDIINRKELIKQFADVRVVKTNGK